MRRHFLVGSYLVVVASMLASSGAPADSATTTRRDVPAPTYMNAEVIRVDADASTITLKSESGETVLQVEGEARAALAGLREKDKVIVGYNVVDDGAGGSRRVVIQVRPASPSSGEPGPAAPAPPTRVVEPVAAQPVTVRTTPTLRTIDKARIVRVEPATNRITVKDSLGRTHVLVVQEHARQDLGVLGPGEVVTLGVQGDPEQVVQIRRGVVAATPATPAQLEAIRESAAQDFEVTAAQLATQANAIDALWLGFQEACLPKPPPTNRSRGWFQLLDGAIPEPDQDGCRQQYKEIISRGERLRDSIKLAEDAARKAEVLPGTLRETLERHRLDL